MDSIAFLAKCRDVRWDKEKIWSGISCSLFSSKTSRCRLLILSSLLLSSIFFRAFLASSNVISVPNISSSPFGSDLMALLVRLSSLSWQLVKLFASSGGMLLRPEDVIVNEVSWGSLEATVFTSDDLIFFLRLATEKEAPPSPSREELCSTKRDMSFPIFWFLELVVYLLLLVVVVGFFLVRSNETGVNVFKIQIQSPKQQSSFVQGRKVLSFLSNDNNHQTKGSFCWKKNKNNNKRQMTSKIWTTTGPPRNRRKRRTTSRCYCYNQ